ncbi:hypothetical protein ACHRV1_12205 [Flavobacterium aquidurense]|uniref:hypothetical protein n=1 Tax=Flavobacterium aquidurense TaxID=362413 RepID=UPI003756E265
MNKFIFRKYLKKITSLSFCFLFLMFSNCSTNRKIEKEKMYGYWIATIKSDTTSDKFIDEKYYYTILESGTEVDSIPMTYRIRNCRFKIFSSKYLMSKYDIKVLTTDSLVLKRIGDDKVAAYIKRK